MQQVAFSAEQTKVSPPFNQSNSNTIAMSWCNSPNNIMNQPSLLQVLCEILPRPSLNLFGKPSPLGLPIFHALNMFLCNPSLLLEACANLQAKQCRPIAVSAQRKCCGCGKTARSRWGPTGGEEVSVRRSAERCHLWPHWTGLRM
jgi:hypothetical protein